MAFASPVAFVLAPFLAWVIALYFIKSKPRKRLVPSTAFWEIVLERMNESALWQRYRGSIFLFMQLLGLGLAMLALADPFFPGGISGDTVIVLDTSASMKAADVSPSRFEKARDEASSLAGKFVGKSRVMVVAMGRSPRVVLPMTTEISRLKAVLAGLSPSEAPGCPESDLADFLRSASGNGLANVYIFSDRFDARPLVNALPGTTVVVRNMAASPDNKGIVSFRIAGTPRRAMAVVEVANFDESPFRGMVELACLYSDLDAKQPGGRMVRKPLVLPARSRKGPATAMVMFGPFAVGRLPELFRARVSMSDGSELEDFLPVDDRAWLTVDSRKVRVAVVTVSDRAPLSRVLSTIPQLYFKLFSSVQAARSWDSGASGGGADLYILDGVDPTPLASAPAIVFHPLGRSCLSSGETFENPSPFVSDSTHPVVKYLGFSGTRVEKAVRLDLAGGDTVLSSDKGPLMVCRTGVFRGRPFRQVLCAFPLSAGNFSFRVGFPVFMMNALKWILGDDLELARFSRAGEASDPSRIPGGSKGLSWSFGDPLAGGRMSPVKVEAGHTPKFDRIGVYRLSGRGIELFNPVNLCDPSESDIAPTGAGDFRREARTRRKTGEEVPVTGTGDRYWFYFALGALVALMGEWFLYCGKGA